MLRNRIGELRKAKGLSQQQLAIAANTTQEQIQRIEAGVQRARFDTATRICSALGESMDRVFPSTVLPLARARRGGAVKPYSDQKVSAELEGAGLDMATMQYTLHYRLRGGAQGFLPLSEPDARRLEAIFQNENWEGFAVFDSDSRRYAINPGHLMLWQFLFEVNIELEHSDDDQLQVRLVDGELMRFGVRPDTVSIEDESADLEVQLQDLFVCAGDGARSVLGFEDEDGETVFFRVKDVSMFSIPISKVEPRILENEEE